MTPSARPRGWARSLLGADPVDAWQGFLALFISALTSLIAGVVLAGARDTLQEFPGLFLLVPAAIGLRGNIFGALGSRLGTTIHTGTFTLSRRPSSVLGQNTLAALALTMALSVALAVMASLVALAFDVTGTISVADYVAVSVIGGVMASVVVLAITIVLAALAQRRRLDLDNVVSPLITAAGDLVTLPALIFSARFARVDLVTPIVAWIAVGLSIVGVMLSLRSGLAELARIVKESLPVLCVAGLFDLVAGVVVEKRLDSFSALPALLILLPGYLETAGALGGILSSRLSTKFHLGLVEPSPWPGRLAWRDVRLIAWLAAPTFAVNGIVAQVGAELTGDASPGWLDMMLVPLLGGAVATLAVVVVAYYGTMTAMRLGADPDTYGTPLVTASLDFVGAFSFIFAAVALGII